MQRDEVFNSISSSHFEMFIDRYYVIWHHGIVRTSNLLITKLPQILIPNSIFYWSFRKKLKWICQKSSFFSYCVTLYLSCLIQLSSTFDGAVSTCSFRCYSNWFADHSATPSDFPGSQRRHHSVAGHLLHRLLLLGRVYSDHTDCPFRNSIFYWSLMRNERKWMKILFIWLLCSRFLRILFFGHLDQHSHNVLY